MHFLKEISLIFVLVFLTGCHTFSSQSSQKLSKQEAQQSLKAVAVAISGKNLSDEEFQQIEREVRKDPQAQKAVVTITNSLAGQPGSVKYCPIDGKRFSSRLLGCPDHHIHLKEVE